ncbi:MAG: DNA primase [Rhodospirillales bacterium]
MARLPDSFLEELRARTPLPALIGRRVRLVRSGRQWKGCCPFHGEKTPSFYVYDDGYHCFGCGAHGDAVTFVMQAQGASFLEAVEILAGEAGLEIPKPSPEAAEAERRRLDLHGVLDSAAALYQQSLFAPEGAAALAYLRGRGLSDATIRSFGLGYAGEGRGALARRLAADGVTPDQLLEAGLLRPGEDGAPRGELFFNRVMFPIRDRRGRVISFGGRIMGEGQPKYVNGPETPLFSKRRTLYALDIAREAVRAGAAIVAVEGYMDVIALHQAGFAGAVAPLGTALTEEQLEALWQLSPAPTLCFDGDAAGARAAARAAEAALPHLAPDRTIRIATLPAGEDPDSLVRGSGAAAFTAVLQAARPLAEALFDLLREEAPGTSPEQRAAFRSRLAAAAARIADRGLAAEYRRHLLDRFYQGSRRGTPLPARRAAPRPVPAEDTAIAERTRTLAAILLRHPALLPRLEEAFSALPLPPSGRRLLAGLQDYADGADSLDSTGVIAHLTNLRLADDVAWALGNGNLPLADCAGADVTVGVAEAGWWQIYGLMRRSSLEADVATARREFAAAPTEAAQARLIALAAALAAARGGGLLPDDELGK